MCANVAGETGLNIIRAILDGERDPRLLAALRNKRVRASEEEIAKSLHGNWREEHVFAPGQAVALYDAYEQALVQCDEHLGRALERLACHEAPEEQPCGRGRRKQPGPFDLRTTLIRASRLDAYRRHREQH